VFPFKVLFSGRYPKPLLNKGTFKFLVSLCSRDVILLLHNGYYKQIDGLAMGSPQAPLLANGWLSKFDHIIKGDARLFSMDDILREIDHRNANEK